MKQSIFKFFLAISIIGLLYSCKKTTTVKQPPLWYIKANLVFTPQDIGTTGTNQTDTMCTGSGEIYLENRGTDSSYLSMYFDIKGQVWHPPYPPQPEGYSNLSYLISLNSPNFKKDNLKVGEMDWTSTNLPSNAPILCSMGWFNGERHDNVWNSIPANSNINFSSFADSYVKFTISEIYSQHEERGDFTYVNGSFDVTLLGYGYVGSVPAARYWDQAHLTGNFKNMVLIK